MGGDTNMGGGGGNEEKLIFSLQNDLKTLSLETKKKYGWIKDGCEEAIAKIRSAQQHHQGQGGQGQNAMSYITNQALYPIIQGCDTKDPKIVKVNILLTNIYIYCIEIVLVFPIQNMYR